MIRVVKSIPISLTPQRKAFWFFFARPELTLARWVAYVAVAGLTYTALLAMGLSPWFCLLGPFAEAAVFVTLHFSAYRATMKTFRNAFALGSADKIIAALDATAEDLRGRKLLRARSAGFCFADNAFPRDLYVRTIAACFARWAAREDDAQDRFDDIVQKCEDHVLAWECLGEMHAEGGDVTTALHCFDKALLACPSFGYGRLVKAAWLYAFNKNDAAREEIALVSARDGERFGVLPHIAAVIALAEDRTDDAREALGRALEAQPVEKVARAVCKAVFPDMHKPSL